MSVCGTGAIHVKFSRFSREYDYTHFTLGKPSVYFQVQLNGGFAYRLYVYTLQRPIRQVAELSLLRLHITMYASN